MDEISDAPWIVERGSIAWMIREGENGPQVGNCILEADARWVAAARNAAAPAPLALDVERLAEVLHGFDCSDRTIRGVDWRFLRGDSGRDFDRHIHDEHCADVHWDQERE